jgi:transcriptional regulator with XRE-family HTH domain
MTQSGSRKKSTITVPQIRAARGLLGWSQAELAKRAGLSRETVKRVEAPSDLKVSTQARAKLQRALENRGVQFLEENGGGPGLRLKARRQPKMRSHDAST